MNAPKQGVVNIRGKEYKTVALRVNEFREDEKFKDYGMVTGILEMDNIKVVMKCEIYSPDGKIVATGHAEEFRASGNINRTSAVENCETSAIGRALAALGLAGQEFASANEVQAAMQQQQLAPPEKVAAIQEYVNQGIVQEGQLLASFGHADPKRLFGIEADRIINAVVTAQQQAGE